MKGFLLDSDYVKRGECPYVRLFVKCGDETITALDPNFEPYLYVVAERPSRLAKVIGKLQVQKGGRTLKPKSVEVAERTLLGKKVESIKVAFHHQDDMPLLRHEIRGFPEVEDIYEFDIPPARRYLVDHELVPMSGVEIKGRVSKENGRKEMLLEEPPTPTGVSEPGLNIMSFDIEVYNPAGSPRHEKDPIIMVSLADNRGFRRVLTWRDFNAGLDYVEVVPDESEMLKRFIQIIRERDVDILVGYNTDLFDFPYMHDRAAKLGIKLRLGRDGSEIKTQKRRFATVTRVPGRVHADVYAMVNFLATIGAIKLINYTLENVYRHVTGKEKPEIEWMNFCEAWDGGGEKAKRLLEYSMSDAEATLELGLEFLPLFSELSRTVRQSLFDISRMTSGQLVEWLLVSEAHRRGELVPARPVGGEYLERRGETYVGAYVMEPVKGLHEDLVVYDFRSLYPSIIVTHNIDPATFNCDCCKPEEATIVPDLNYKFCKKREGFIPLTLERLIKNRSKLKEKMKKHKKGSRKYHSLHARQWALKILANSVDGGEPVVLRDSSGHIQVKPIGSFVDKLMGGAKVRHVGNTEVADPQPKWEALSFNGARVMFAPVKKIIRHPAPKNMYEIKLKSGKKVRVTADHSVFTLDQNLNVKSVETCKLKCGDYILTPRRVPSNSSMQGALNLVQEFSGLPPDLLRDICVYVNERPRRSMVETRIKILELLSDGKFRYINQIAKKIGRGRRCVSRNVTSLVEDGCLREIVKKRNLRVVGVTKRGIKKSRIERLLLEHLKYDGSKRRHLAFLKDLRPIVELLDDKEIGDWKIGVYGHGRKFDPIIKATPEFFRLLGYFIAEGSSNVAQNPRGGRSYLISIANENKEIREDIINCIKSTFDVNPYVWRKGIQITQKVPYLVLAVVLDMGLKAAEKRIPKLVLSSSPEHQLAFLYAYWRGNENYREPTGQHVFTTKSRGLITDLSLLLSQLGVNATLVEDSGVRRVIVNEDLPFKPSTSIDRRGYSHVVPGELIAPLVKKVRKYRHVLQGKNIRIKKAVKLVNEFLRTNPDDAYTNKLLEFLEGDLMLEEIAEINAVKTSGKHVYDLSVEGNENFVGGYGLVCLHNSFYGMLGYPRARWYSKECAESVTSFGRHYIKDTIEMAKKEGFEVIYSDTDSLYCKLNGKKPEDAMRFLRQVNESLPGIMELELEDFYERGVFVTKKRYAVIDRDEKILVKGLEFVRRDWAALAKKTQEAVLKAILREGSPKKAAAVVQRTTKDIYEGKVDLDDLVIYTQLKMPLGEYRAIGPHVAAARKLKAKGREIEPGMTIAYIVAKGPGSISDRAIPIEDFEGMSYDPDYYVKHQVLPAVMRIMEVLGYGEDDLRYEKSKQVKLGKFMGG